MFIPASAVIDIYTKLEKLGIQIWIDGGWAVDALLQKQTREHRDLDIAVQRKDLIKLKDFFLISRICRYRKR
jgi:lincosamide nucleotidyltransferase A/C/D/E